MGRIELASPGTPPLNVMISSSCNPKVGLLFLLLLVNTEEEEEEQRVRSSSVERVRVGQTNSQRKTISRRSSMSLVRSSLVGSPTTVPVVYLLPMYYTCTYTAVQSRPIIKKREFVRHFPDSFHSSSSSSQPGTR